VLLHGKELKEQTMSNISRETAPNVVDPGPVEVRSGELGGYTVDFMTVRQRHDMAPLLVGLPDDHCPCPHWGYVLKGRITFRHVNGATEVVGAGDAFYLEPGHIPTFDAGTEYVQFSPTEAHAALDKAIDANLSAMMAAMPNA
jgi:hypothetical protein